MKAICSYCRKDMGEREPVNDLRMTHGICPPCYEHMKARMRVKPLPEYLDSLSKPVVVVDVEGRFMTCNRKAEEILGSKRDAFLGYLGGEFLECDNARSVVGCGKNLACSDCPITRTIKETRDTGVIQENVPAFLNTVDSGKSVRRKMTISTEKDGEYVRLRIDSIS